MSTQNRSAGSRSKASKAKTTQNEAPASTPAQETTLKAATKVSADAVKPDKEKVQIKPTAEQIRIAQITDIKGGIDDPKIREKVLNLMEMTQRSEEDVCCALYECDNDLDRAVIFLLEQLPVGAFATTSKKKKNKTKDENAGETEWNNENTAPNSDAREKGRNRGGGISNGRDKGGRPRDKKRDGDRNGASEFKVDTFRSGPDRDKGKLSKRDVPGGSRGGRGGRRETQGRSNYRENRSRNVEHQEIDSWDASQGIVTEKQKEVPIDTWGDWDNEEYKNTLADSKVFSGGSSITAATAIGNQPELAAPPGLEQQILSAPTQQIDSYSSAISANTNATSTSQSQYSDLHSGTSAAAQLRQALELPQIQSTTLSAEQSQYFNTLSSQNSGSQYNSSFPANQYNVSEHATQRARRSRVPPPSKIPSSAVEMPGDNLSNIAYLDVQFGALDFGTDDSFDAVNDKFRDATLDTSQTLSSSDVGEYQNSKASQGSTLAATALQANQLLANADPITAHTDSISSRSVNNGSAGSNAAFSLNKPESYISQSNTAASYQAGTFASNAKMTSYQQNYGSSSSYPNSQGTNYTPASSNTYSSFNPSAAGSFPQSSSVAVSSAVGSVPNNGNQNNANANQTHGNSQNVNSNSSYLSNQYSVNPTSSTSYVSPQNPYQSNQTFGASGLSSSSGFPTSTNTSSSTFNSFSTSKIKDTSVSTTFDSSNVATAATSTSNSTSVNLSSPSLGLNSSKSINSTAKSGSATMVANIPTMVNQYIQTPGGMPFYQPQIYSFEDLQMVQPRVSHVPGYFDINYQTPTSLGAAGVREGNLGSVAYSAMSDARFTRTDNNSSPVSNVPSTISQQTGSGGPMLNLPYAYFYSSNAMMPGQFQYGAPAIYPQQMATANATSGGQFPKPSYNSNYGSSSYDNLTQGNQEYGKTSYAGSGVGQNKAQTASNPQGVGNSGSDMSSSMYGKSHAGLSKSYENKSFHSGTPPPFNLVGSQTALNSASAQPYGSQHLYIPTMPAPHHNIGMHQPHQDSSRQQPSNQGKSGTKQGYSPSYWTAQS